MKHLLFILSFLILLGCQKDKMTKISTETLQGKISFKEEYGKYRHYILYVQNPTNTRIVEVDGDTYDKYKLGDSILLVVEKYQIPCEGKKNDDWKKPKINYHQINLHN